MRTARFPIAAVVLGMAWVVLVGSTLLIYPKIHFQSDLLYFDELYRDLVELDGDLTLWRFTGAPAFVPDVIAYFAAATVLRDFVDRVMAVDLIQVVILALLCFFLLRRVRAGHAAHWAVRAVVLGLLAVVSLTAATSGMWMYFHTTNNHVPSLIFGLLGTCFLIARLQGGGGRDLLWLGVSIVVGAVSSSVMLVTFVPAAFLLAAGILAYDLKSARSPVRTSALLGTIVASAAISRLLTKVLVRFPLLDGRVKFEPKRAGESLAHFLSAERDIWPSRHPGFLALYVVVLLGLLAAGLLLLPSRREPPEAAGKVWSKLAGWMERWPEPSPAQRWVALLLLILVPVNLAGAILSGGYVDSAGHRYFMLPAFLATLVLLSELERMRQVFPRAAGPSGSAWVASCPGCHIPPESTSPSIAPPDSSRRAWSGGAVFSPPEEAHPRSNARADVARRVRGYLRLRPGMASSAWRAGVRWDTGPFGPSAHHGVWIGGNPSVAEFCDLEDRSI